MPGDVREQLLRVISSLLLLTCKFQGSNSGCQAVWQLLDQLSSVPYAHADLFIITRLKIS